MIWINIINVLMYRHKNDPQNNNIVGFMGLINIIMIQ